MINEQQAQQIIEKFGLSEKTLAVWKHRGSIPERYLKEGYNRETIDEKTDVDNQRFAAWLNSNQSIRKKALAVLCDINPSRFIELQRGKTRLTPTEILRVRKELKKLNIEARKFNSYEKEDFKKFLRRDVIVLTYFFGKELYTIMSGYLDGRRGFPQDREGEIRTRVMEFAVSLNF